MSYFKNLFKSENKEEVKSHVQWIPLTSIQQLEAIKKESKNETVLVFKHSTRCGISRMVIKQFEKKFDESMNSAKVYYLDLLSYRDVSDEVGYTFQVMHQSPQLLIIKNEIVVAHTSHYDITVMDFKQYL